MNQIQERRKIAMMYLTEDADIYPEILPTFPFSCLKSLFLNWYRLSIPHLKKWCFCLYVNNMYFSRMLLLRCRPDEFTLGQHKPALLKKAICSLYQRLFFYRLRTIPASLLSCFILKQVSMCVLWYNCSENCSKLKLTVLLTGHFLSQICHTDTFGLAAKQ